MSSTGSSGDSSRPDRPAASTTDSSSNLLQQMLEATLLDRKGQLSSDEWSGLRAIALEAHQRNLGIVELVEALVKELLTSRFSNLKQDEATSKRLCHKIAITLTADPHSRQRLQEFQQHLLRPQN